MKITFFLEDYYLGGVDTFVINLINSWPETSDEIVLICNHNHSGLKLIEETVTRPFKLVKHKMAVFTGFFELKLKSRLTHRISVSVLRFLSPILRYVYLSYNIFALKKILLQNDPDRLMIINGGYPGGDSCRAAGISWAFFSGKSLSIHSVHGIALRPGWHISLQEYVIDKLLSASTKYFITVSKAAAESLCIRKGIDNKKFICVYNGIGPQKNDLKNGNEPIRKEIGLLPESKLCLMMGGYHCHKNFDKGHYFLIQVFKKVVRMIPDAHLLICGYGSLEDVERVRRMVNEAGMEKNIHLSNFRKDVTSLLKQVDLVLIGSQTFESFCLASIEAMSQQVPVIATKVGGIPEIVIDGDGGYCVEKDDIETYSGKIIRLLTDAVLSKEQGLKGVMRYEKFFTAGRMARDYAQLLKSYG